jgi:hypothetical protein
MSQNRTAREADGRLLRRILSWSLGVVVVSGLTSELLYAYSHEPWVEQLVELLSLSYEQNLPTWYASLLLFSCAVLLAGIARSATVSRDRFRAHWWMLSMGFVIMSFDEVVELHERLGGLVGGSGVLYFDWVIPAGIAVAALGFVFLRFLQHLPAESRRRFLIAGGVYLTGALAMELPLGWWTERHGPENLPYALIDFVEESLELCGASLFALALWRHSALAREARA